MLQLKLLFTPKQKPLFLLLRLWVLVLIIDIMSLVMKFLFIHLIASYDESLIPADEHSQNVRQAIQSYGFLFVIYLSSIQAPILEEMIFRLPLKFNKYYLPTSIALYPILFELLSKTKFWNGEFPIQKVLIILSIAVLLFLVTFLLLQQSSIQNKIKEYLKNYSLLFVIASSYLFAILHADNVFNPINIILTLPQFIAGIYLGIIRLTYGMRYAITVHILSNLTVIVIPYLWV
ncbi:CPBP family glutamic-type intramembrane protease [Flammeovirga aprica]|uniref:CPBP family intramembrane metalloprotease n=1 Tax=Flammeovirga aprica JL-4 TaxID=694437 RepID=A0A7X9X9U1_9BACT|nr:CPBP family glutamic-type intramembrane protease [Flammeovirga aprica]NME69044.1 CPBP family intramembrane metalloprotease [Flammeovirga aprica JL-4]